MISNLMTHTCVCGGVGKCIGADDGSRPGVCSHLRLGRCHTPLGRDQGGGGGRRRRGPGILDASLDVMDRRDLLAEGWCDVGTRSSRMQVPADFMIRTGGGVPCGPYACGRQCCNCRTGTI